MTTVREINNPAELETLRRTWNDLLARTPQATFCQSLDWLQAFWNHYGAGKRLRVLVVEEGAEVIGILPLAVWAAHRREPFEALTYPLDYWGDSYGPIGPDPLATLRAGLDHIRRTPRDWHFIDLAWVDDVADGGATNEALRHNGFPAVRECMGSNATIDLEALGSWDAYCAAHDSGWRNNLKRNEKKLARRGKVTYVRHRRAGDATRLPWDAYEACEAISKLSWQGQAPRGTMLTKEVDRGFFRECFERSTPCGGVDLDLLFVDEQPVAFSYSYYYRGRLCQVKPAYRPDYRGAGSVLMARLIAESFARGDHTIEFGGEFLEYKRLWATHLVPIYRYVYFPRSLGAQIVRGKRALARALRPFTRGRRCRQQPAS